MEHDGCTAILAKINALGDQLAEHKVSSSRRSDELSDKIDAIGTAQKSNTSQLNALHTACNNAISQASRAIETSLEAKRVAQDSAHEAKAVYSAISTHNEGIGDRLSKQDEVIAKIHVETSTQTKMLEDVVDAGNVRAALLERLAAAETERKIREQARDEFIAKDSAKNDRWLKNIATMFAIITPIFAGAAWLIGHFMH